MAENGGDSTGTAQTCTFRVSWNVRGKGRRL